MERDLIAMLFSGASLILSILVAYLTLFRSGSVRMTPPTVVYFGPDAGNGEGFSVSPKIFLRTLLYSTAKKGSVISGMHVKVTRGETTQTFNIWAYGEIKNLVRGSGLYVGEQGVAFNHHFLPPSDENSFKFSAGAYRLEVFVSHIDRKQPTLLWSDTFALTEPLAKKIKDELATGVYFDWQPNSGNYHAHTR